MSNGLPKQPTFRSIALGIVLFVIVLVAFLRIPDVIKFSGAAIMFVPAKLGLIDMPMPKDVVPLPLDQNPSEITFTSPGQYMMYLNIYDLLVVHDAVVAKNSDSWMKIQSEDLGTNIALTFIGRGLAWYDTPFAPGRPVVTFTIDQPGTYQFTHPARPLQYMYLVPDTVTGNETWITFWMLAEIVLIVGVVIYIVRKRTATRRRQQVNIQAQNRARVESTWNRIDERKKEKQREDDQPHWKKR
jgi:hypothetical protein